MSGKQCEVLNVSCKSAFGNYRRSSPTGNVKVIRVQSSAFLYKVARAAKASKTVKFIGNTEVNESG